MRTTTPRHLAVLLLGAGALLAPAAQAAAVGPARLVSLRPTVSAGDYAGRPTALFRALQADATRGQAALRRRMAPLVRAGHVRFGRAFWISNAVAVRADRTGVRALRRDAAVRAVVSDRVGLVVPPEDLRRGGAARTEMVTGTPQPNLSVIGAPAMWAAGYEGQGMKVGVMDTDIDVTHPAFGCTTGQTWTQAGSKCGRVIAYGDFNFADPFAREPGLAVHQLVGHGTNVTSILAGGEDQGQVWGVAPQAKILFARIWGTDGSFGTMQTDLSRILAAGQWLADPDGNPATSADRPAVINGSWGLTQIQPSNFAHDMIRVWRAADIVPVFAAGNSGPAQGTVAVPAGYPDVVGVGNIDNSEVIRNDSSRGCDPADPTRQPTRDGGDCMDSSTFGREDGLGPPPGPVYKPDVVAPGAQVWSACHHTQTCYSWGGQYGWGSGTSFSSPHVAGAVALLRQHHPGWTAGQVIAAVRDTARDKGPLGWDNAYGFGVADLTLADAYTPDAQAPALSGWTPPAWVSGTARATFTVSPAGERLDDIHLQGPGAVRVTGYDRATGTLSVEASLPQGQSTIAVQVVDEAGHASNQVSVPVRSDITHPQVTVDPVSAGPVAGDSYTFTGTASDVGSGVVQVEAYLGTDLPPAAPAGMAVPGPDGRWSWTLPLAQGEWRRVTFDVVDGVGRRMSSGDAPALPWAEVRRPLPPPVVDPPRTPGGPAPGPSAPLAPTTPQTPSTPRTPQPSPGGGPLVVQAFGRVTSRGLGRLVVPLRASRAGEVTVRATGARFSARLAVHAGSQRVLVRVPPRVVRRVSLLVLSAGGQTVGRIRLRGGRVVG